MLENPPALVAGSAGTDPTEQQFRKVMIFN